MSANDPKRTSLLALRISVPDPDQTSAHDKRTINKARLSSYRGQSAAPFLRLFPRLLGSLR